MGPAPLAAAIQSDSLPQHQRPDSYGPSNRLKVVATFSSGTGEIGGLLTMETFVLANPVNCSNSAGRLGPFAAGCPDATGHEIRCPVQSSGGRPRHDPTGAVGTVADFRLLSAVCWGRPIIKVNAHAWYVATGEGDRYGPSGIMNTAKEL